MRLTSMTNSSVSSRHVYSARDDLRRYYTHGRCVGFLQPSWSESNVWWVDFTEPQSENLPWTDFHAPRVLKRREVVAREVASADLQARDWLEAEYLRWQFGEAVAEIIEDYLACERASLLLGSRQH